MDEPIVDDVSISLIKVFDEMVMDKTDIDVIIQFLKSHDSSVPEIFKGSSLAYELYDLAYPMGGWDEYLVSKIRYLPRTDFYYAMMCNVKGIMDNGLKKEYMPILRKHVASTMTKYNFKKNIGVSHVVDSDIMASEKDLVDVANGFEDRRDISAFINRSCFFRSLMMANNFLRLRGDIQMLVLEGIVNDAKNSICHDNTMKDKDAIWGTYENIFNPSVDMLMSLLKQLLVLNQVEMFNWVMNFVNASHPYNRKLTWGWGVDESHYANIFDRVNNYFKSKFPTSIKEHINNLGINNETSFEVMTFDMNMVDTQFDPVDLFLYIYVTRPKSIFKGMMENKDLLEFYTLTFDWNELTYIKDYKGE